MSAKEIIGINLVGNIDKYFAQDKVFSKKSDIGTRVDGVDHSIRRNESGMIDYTYYAVRARSLRSESTFLFLKALVNCLTFRK